MGHLPFPVPQILPGNFDLTQLSVELHQLPFNYNPTRKREIKTHIPEELNWKSHAWLRIDRVKRPLEAPYQGPFEILRRSEDTITLSIRGKPVVVSLDRVKPATLPEKTSLSQQEQKTEEKNAIHPFPQNESPIEPKQTRTRSGRQVRFQKEESYEYF